MSKYPILTVIALLMGTLVCSQGACNRSVTTFGGTGALFNEGIDVCSGDLIFDENFDTLDEERWQHELWHNSFRNGEFQQYVNDRSVSYTQNGILNIKPRIQGDFGDGSVPIQSARMNSNFHFTYGFVEIKAKLPGGDWLWPAIWMLPQDSFYGEFPTSGEMDLIEGRGNDYIEAEGVNIGNVQMTSTMHWGPDAAHNEYERTHGEHNHNTPLCNEFHIYSFEWQPDFVSYRIDGNEILRVTPPDGGFWELGELSKSGMDNPWASGSKMAPFDKDFHFILNIAVGGTTGYFPDGLGNKPWKSDAPNPSADFWSARVQWEPTWQTNTDHSAMKIDYIKVWAL